MNEQDPGSAPTQGIPSGAAPGYPGTPPAQGTGGYPGAPGAPGTPGYPDTPGYPGAPSGADPRAAWAAPGGTPAPSGSQWGGPTAGGAPAPGSAGHPIPLQPAPVLFKPEPKRRGGPSAFAVVFTLAALLCVGGVAFAAGRLTAPAAAAATNTGPTGFGNNGFGNGRRPNASLAPGATFDPGAFGNGGFGGLTGGLSIEGTVTSVAADGTITLSLSSGGTLDVATDGQTTYHNETSGTAASVKTGATVRVQLSRAAFGNGFGGPQAPGASPAPDASGAPVTTTATDILVVTP